MAEMDAFKAAFKRYKSKKAPIPVTELPALLGQPCTPTHALTDPGWGLRPTDAWSLVHAQRHPGLILIRRAFSPTAQLNWALRCTRDFTRQPPHRTNLPHVPRWFESALADPDLPSRMRWSTLGLHHDWNTKVYQADQCSPFPPDLSHLARVVARVGGFEAFQPEAAIVNFYPLSATLGGHTDHSEDNMTAPLLSISLGQSAIFLIGGATKDVAPSPILLESGDILIMSGPARLAYHAVPKIVKTSDTPWRRLENEDEFSTAEQDFALEYLASHRININIRQVH